MTENKTPLSDEAILKEAEEFVFSKNSVAEDDAEYSDYCTDSLASQIIKKAISLTREAERKSNEEEIKKLVMKNITLDNENSNIKVELKEFKLQFDERVKQQLSSQKEKILEDLKEWINKNVSYWAYYDKFGESITELPKKLFEDLKNKIESKQEVSIHSLQEVSNEGENK